MNTVPITAARAKLPELVEIAQEEAVTLSRHGKPAAVLINPDAYERMLEALEDVADMAAFDSAMEDENPSIPWDEVKADLGLV